MTAVNILGLFCNNGLSKNNTGVIDPPRSDPEHVRIFAQECLCIETGVENNMARRTVSDRLKLTLPNGTGDQSTIYGRLDMSDFIDPSSNRGVIVHDVQFQLRNPNGTKNSLTRTGMWSWFENMDGTIGLTWADDNRNVGVKLVALNTAYQDLAEVGISTDGVYAVQEHTAFQAHSSIADSTQGLAGGFASLWYNKEDWTVEDLHGDGMLLLSDLLIGVAMDNLQVGDGLATDIDFEIDVVVHFSEKKVSQKEITQLITSNLDV